MLGSGDSGGPSFMLNPNDPSDLTLYLAMVNTFSFAFTGVPDHDIRGRFGSGSGGVFLNSAYQDWIYNTAVIPETTTWIAGAALATISFAAARARRRKSGH
jgi:hypothetical protein